MTSDFNEVKALLFEAQQAMQRGDKHTARSFAEQAAMAAPNSEEPWLFMAALAGPSASVNYLRRALEINPRSERARNGMHWAIKRLRNERGNESSARYLALQKEYQNKEAESEITRPTFSARASEEPKTQPRKRNFQVSLAMTGSLPSEVVAPRSIVSKRVSFLTLILAGILVTGAWVFWPGSTAPSLAFFDAPRSVGILPAIPVQLSKPTYTPSPTDTATATSTPTSTPTATSTPLPTDTPVPTNTPLPTQTPLPTSTLIPWPTDTPELISDTGSGGNKWIDVNLSEQRLYAYEGDTVVASFLVSTGVWQFPTVTGQYHIYVKYVSTLMTGDGYYLPDVPYTMYFYKGYGIHGTYWHNNFGHPMSHGCVNMYTPDAEWMFYWAPLGTLVNIHY